MLELAVVCFDPVVGNRNPASADAVAGPLAADGVCLQATEDYREFDEAALTRVFEAVTPALRPLAAP
ncbi:hypothetical protein AB0K00_52175 [Dactylosporangium sp. NPDC049525]|uniref:hypothetical protein n=1 Tax=Dactylosporangium sp. NPDC049525 TaxID=3154730 RepID=UPI00343737F1